MDIVIGLSDICTAFDSFTIGSKVVDHEKFLVKLVDEIARHDFDNDRIPGQAFLVINSALPYVSAGDGPKSDNKDDYIIAEHRGQPKLCLKREKAGEAKFLGCVVYTKESYFRDPEVDPNEKLRALLLKHPHNHAGIHTITHVLVAVIASSGPQSPLTPYRFVSNLAGGNLEALDWTADEIRAKAREIKEYWDNWSVVAG